MEWIQDVYLTPSALGQLPPLIFSLVIAAFLFMHPDRSRHSRAAGMFFFFRTVAHAGIFLNMAVHHPAGVIGFYLVSLVPFVWAFLVQFCYLFPQNQFDRERRIVVPIAFTLAALAFLEFAVFAAGSPVEISVAGYGSTYRSVLVPTVGLLLLIWAMIVFVRKTLHHSEVFHARSWRPGDLLDPGGKEARACRNFLLFLLLEMAHGLFLASEIFFRQLPHLQSIVLTSLSFFFLYSSYLVVILKYYGGSVAISFKILGFGLVTSLLFVVLAAQLHFSRVDRFFEARVQGQLEQLGKQLNETQDAPIVPALAGGFPEELLFLVRFRADGANGTLYDESDALADVRRLNLWEFAPRILEYHRSPRHPGFAQIKKRIGREFHLRLPERNVLVYPFEAGGRVYGAGFDYMDYRRFLHESAGGVLFLYLFALLINLIVLPLLLGRVFSQPLRQLISGLYDSHESPVLQIRSGSKNEIEILNEALAKVGAEREEKKRIEAEYQALKESQEKPESEADESRAPSDHSRERIARVESYLQENYNSDLSREGLAAMVDLSPGRLGKYFRQVTGLKIGEYINRLRVEHAARLLGETDKTVLEIAYEVGFESLRTFNRVFLQERGVNPAGFRMKHDEPAA